MVINFQTLPVIESFESDTISRIDWSSLSQEEIVSYCVSTERLLGKIWLPKEAIMCRDCLCQNPKHHSDICSMFEDLNKALLDSSKSAFRTKRVKKIIPGWNSYVAEFYVKAREAFRDWRLAGKPRHGPVFENKRVTNAQYKYAIRYIRKNAEAMKADSMARKL